MSGPNLNAQYYTMRPTRFTRFMRVFFPWQIIRFLIVNFRMTIMIMKSHDKKIETEGDKLK